MISSDLCRAQQRDLDSHKADLLVVRAVTFPLECVSETIIPGVRRPPGPECLARLVWRIETGEDGDEELGDLGWDSKLCVSAMHEERIRYVFLYLVRGSILPVGDEYAKILKK